MRQVLLSRGYVDRVGEVGRGLVALGWGLSKQ